jgi:hypothetical protein
MNRQGPCSGRASFALALLGLALVPLLAAGAAPARPAQPLKEYARASQGRHAYGLYIQNRKAGWVVSQSKLGKHDGKEVLVKTTEVNLTILVDGVRMVKQEKGTDCYALEGPGVLVFHEKRTWQGKKESLCRVARKDGHMLVTTRQGAHATERRVALGKSTLEDSRRFVAWLARAKKGQTFERWDTDWDRDTPEVKEVCTFQEKKAVVRDGKQVAVYALALAAPTMRMSAVVFGNGALLEGELEGGVVSFRLEKEAEARKMEAPADPLRALAVSVDSYLGKPGFGLEKLTLEVTGLGDFELPQSHRQSSRPGKNGTVLVELQNDYRTPRAAPLASAERTRYTKATPRLQSDHQAIRALARKVAGKEQEPVKVATLLSQWVHRNVRKTYSESPDNALAVLDGMGGACKEHTLLFVALARAAGLPARDVGGLGYCLIGGKPAFGWHAWAEIHDGTQWVSVDPTWNQVYVDVAHIKFSEGREDSRWMSVAGKLKFRVLKEELVRVAKAG